MDSYPIFRPPVSWPIKNKKAEKPFPAPDPALPCEKWEWAILHTFGPRWWKWLPGARIRFKRLVNVYPPFTAVIRVHAAIERIAYSIEERSILSAKQAKKGHSFLLRARDTILGTESFQFCTRTQTTKGIGEQEGKIILTMTPLSMLAGG